MALVYADRVKETSITTGTGTLTLAGAVVGFQAFTDALADGDTCYYTITDNTDWEVGLGTFTTTGTTLARTTVLASSNADAAVSWGAGSKDVFITNPADKITSPTVTSPTINTSIAGSAFLDEDNMVSDSATKVASQQSIKKYIDDAITQAKSDMEIAVGDIHISTVSTNPATNLGYGTWTAFGAGRVLVSLDSTDTDWDTPEETGGAKTATIAQANLPNISTGAGTAHTHTQNSHTHGATTAFTSAAYHATTGTTAGASTYRGLGNNSAPTTGATTATNQNESAHTHSLGGNGTAMDVMNPYIAVYMWKRTA